MAAEDFVFQIKHQHQWAVTTSEPGTYSHREREKERERERGNSGAMLLLLSLLVVWLTYLLLGQAVGFYTPATPAKGHTGHTHFVFGHALASCLPTCK